MTSPATLPIPHPGAIRRARRCPRVRALAWAVAGVLVLGALTGLAAAWYATDRLLTVTHTQDSYPLRVFAVGSGARTVALRAGPDAGEPGTFRLAWRGGAAIIGGVLRYSAVSVNRRVRVVRGHLRAGLAVGVEPDRYTGDPSMALGLRFRIAEVRTPLGAMPAWAIAGRRRTWVILVHGLGGSRADTLPPMPALHRLGFPMLAISYRSDAGAPASPDHQGHLGTTEWRDVAAAIRYALGHGATGVVLYGFSMGGLMSLTTVERSALARSVRGVILDSPILDWPSTLDYDAAERGVPEPLAALTETLLAWRLHISWSESDQLTLERRLPVPVLVIQGTADRFVPPSLARRFAAARPRLITYLAVRGADHVSAIDTAPRRYCAALTRFLTARAARPSPRSPARAAIRQRRPAAGPGSKR